jgi:predicted phage replisome organizer
MAEKRYYWLKLQEDFFSSLRIKKLRKIAGGDTYTIIYLKMQLMSIRNGGVLRYCGIEKSFAEELALDMDEDVENVSVTLQYLLACGLIETSDNIEYLLPFAALNTGSEGSGAKRVREFREKQKALHCNADVTQLKQICNGDIDIEKEIDIEKDIPPISPKTDFDNPFDGELREAFSDWMAYKEEKKQPYKPRGLQSLKTQIKKYAEQYGDAETANAIRNSMASNYQGIVFERIGKSAQATADARRKAESRPTAKRSEDYRGESFFDE